MPLLCQRHLAHHIEGNRKGKTRSTGLPRGQPERQHGAASGASLASFRSSSVTTLAGNLLKVRLLLQMGHRSNARVEKLHARWAMCCIDEIASAAPHTMH
eukprot:7400764-Pyramimonas_sp.AAC.1